MPTDADGPIFLHSMWRTGSSFLLSTFEANNRYLVFYEPWNGEIGSGTLRARARTESTSRRIALRHPGSARSYFQIYDSPDPATGRPLWQLATPRMPLHDVYNGLSRDGERMVAACVRLAKACGRTPVFGFCHSGEQIAELRARFGGAHIYLSRAPAEQFQSYSPGDNDFFVPATMVQLIASRQWHSLAAEFAPALRPFAQPITAVLTRHAPHRFTMRIARSISRRLDPASMFSLFYLSWRISNDHGAHHCSRVVSLALLQNTEQRRWLEQRFGIDLGQLRLPSPSRATLNSETLIPSLQERIDAEIEKARSKLENGPIDWSLKSKPAK